jgi:hypothetical protein
LPAPTPICSDRDSRADQAGAIGRLIRRRGEHVGRVDMLAMVAARNCTGVDRANLLLDFAPFFTVFAGRRCRRSTGGPAML